MQRQRGGLQEAMSKLESVVDRYSDHAVADTSAAGILSFAAASGNSENPLMQSSSSMQIQTQHEGILQLQRQLNKFRTRARMMEDVSEVYRAAFVAATSAQPSASSDRDDPIRAPFSKALVAIRRSYEEEISHLEEEIDTCQGVIRQNNSYMTELRTRLEDTLRTIYR